MGKSIKLRGNHVILAMKCAVEMHIVVSLHSALITVDR